MKFHTFIYVQSLLAAAIFLSPLAADQTDVLRFSNSDQLHGEFLGIDDEGRVIWQRKDSPEKMQFSSKDLMSVILSKNQAQQGAEHSFIRLSNNDIIPGNIVEMNEKTIKLQSSVVGDREIPREHVREICPQPFGRSILYTGPYSKDGWMVLDMNQKEAAPETDTEETPDQEKEAPEVKKQPDTWQHHGITWYRKDGSAALARKDCLSESTMLRFRAKWIGRLNLNLGLHADFSKPPEKKENAEAEEKNENAARKPVLIRGMFMNQESQPFAALLGNSIVLNIYQNYISVSQSTYNAEGKLQTQRISQSSSAVQIPESGDAVFEIRSDRRSGLLMLFVDGQYAAQWEYTVADQNKDKADSISLGNGIAFQATTNKSPMSISEMVIAEWNGVRDSAKSFQNDKNDVALLHNGLDRYSGTLAGIKDGIATFKSSIGQLQIPVNELAEVHFAYKADEKALETISGSIAVAFGPIGKISGKPIRSSQTALSMNHPILGETNVKFDRAIMIQYSDENSILNDFNANDNQLERMKK